MSRFRARLVPARWYFKKAFRRRSDRALRLSFLGICSRELVVAGGRCDSRAQNIYI
jgi:hypothetical protein